jgi:hypothetical protein
MLYPLFVVQCCMFIVDVCYRLFYVRLVIQHRLAGHGDLGEEWNRSLGDGDWDKRGIGGGRQDGSMIPSSAFSPWVS